MDLRTAAQELLRGIQREASPADVAEVAPLFHDLGLALRAFTGKPFSYGVPGSDPNVEQLPDGRLRVSLLQPLVSGQERIEAVYMSPGTLGNFLAAADIKTQGGSDTRVILEKLTKQVRTEQGRLLTRTELGDLLEEEAAMLIGASDFLSERFRTTRRVFRTS
jgi:hypothetical protein